MSDSISLLCSFCHKKLLPQLHKRSNTNYRIHQNKVYAQGMTESTIQRTTISSQRAEPAAKGEAPQQVFNKKKTISQALAEEIVLASEENGESFAVRKKIESEKQADSAR